jgi:hypothetical protein
MRMGHLKLATPLARTAASNTEPAPSEICLVDYSHCSLRDTCWIIDFGANCEGHDGCLIDTG